MSDREKAGRHGLVRTCAVEMILPDGKSYLTTAEYSPDGRLLTFRSTSSDGAEWIMTKTYDVGGRLTKTISGNSCAPGLESVYTYGWSGKAFKYYEQPS
jgi:hypothetical protein